MIRTTLLAAAALLLTGTASAQSVHALDGTHETLAQNYQGRVLFIEFTHPNGFVDYATAIRINDYYAITAGHIISEIKPGTTPVVGTGSNGLTNRGTTRNIVDYDTHPSWVGVFDGSDIDLGWLKFDSPLPGPTESITTSPAGTEFTIVGFGRPATPVLGLQPHDRERRAFEAISDQNGNAGAGVSTDYVKSDFFPIGVRNMPMAGVVTVGNSGSPGYGTDGTLKMMSVVQSGSPGYNSSTYSLRLIRYRTWIEDNTAIPCLPDLNNDGFVDSGDITDFVTLFLASDPAADFNNDGFVDSGDIAEFIALFLAGC